MDKVILLKLIELAGGLLTLCGSALVTTRYWFHCRAKESEERAKVFGELARSFGRDVERLNMATHDLGIRVEESSKSQAELTGKMSMIQPELEEIRKHIPKLMELMNKVHSFFERKYPSSIVKTLPEDSLRVEEQTKSKEKTNASKKND